LDFGFWILKFSLQNAPMRILIVGCGYVGLPLGIQFLTQGHSVFGIRRSAAAIEPLRAAGIEPLIADITRRDDLAKLPLPFDWVINTVSSGKGGIEQYMEVYFQGTRNLIDWLAPAPPRKFVYTSSTSVYAQEDASLVKETSPTEPTTETGKVLAATEKMLLDAVKTKNFPAAILRVAGIYGPQRGHLFLQYLRNEAKITGQGLRWINMIHREDVIGCIVAALENGRPGEIYNAVDDEPVPEIHFFRWLSETLGKNMPPFAPDAPVAQGKRGATNKRVMNRKLKVELGYPFRFPTFRQGYTAEIQRLQTAGEL
jgi:nucleoside-diphosphate-sugar epimerase